MSPDQRHPDQPERVRRSPNYLAFVLTGVVIGVIVGVVLGGRDSGGPSYFDTNRYDTTTARAYLGAFGALLGAMVGGLVAIALDRGARAGGKHKS